MAASSPHIGPEELTAVVLAGGLGTRVRHLLPGLPKPMAPVAGKPFLEWVVRYLAVQGVRNIVLATGYLSEIIEKHFQRHEPEGVRVCCVKEQEPLGTAGGFLHAAGRSGQTPEAWLVLNGDSLAFAPLSQLTEALREPPARGALVGCGVPDASRYGTLEVGPNGELAGFAEKRPGKGVINAGMYLFTASLAGEFPRGTPLSFEADVFPEFARRGVSMKVAVTDNPFLDIGTPESLAQAESFVLANRRHFQNTQEHGSDPE